MKNNLPSIQFYPGDWKKDPGVQALSYHDRGVWFEIILLMHESSERGKLLLNGSKMPEAALARILGLDNQNLTTTLTNLITYGVASICDDTGALCCRRMIRDEKLRQIRKEAGSKGGNPVLVNQKSTTRVKQNPTPSSSSSSSISSSKKEIVTNVTPKKELVLPDWLPLRAWGDFCQMRRSIKKPLTDRAMELIILDIEKLKSRGHDPAEVLNQSVKHSWQGVFEIKATNGGRNEPRDAASTAASEAARIIEKRRAAREAAAGMLAGSGQPDRAAIAGVCESEPIRRQGADDRIPRSGVPDDSGGVSNIKNTGGVH